MPADGDKSSTNTAGAAYGTGYCDAQCPADVKFVSGEANSEGWGASSTGRTTGKYGSCCAEMDLWEANKEATAFTAHPCSVDKLHRCEGPECKTKCDMPGCDFNSYRMGSHKFYGPGPEYEVNTLKPFTIVTQFITVDGTDDGDMSEIRRIYYQDGRKIENSKATLKGLDNQSSLSDESCAVAKQAFGETTDTTKQFGGMRQMGKALERGMTLVLSLWDDGDSNMHWLDSTVGGNPETPGVARGPCSPGVGTPDYVRSHHADAYVEYFNFKYGDLDSTVGSGSSQPSQKPVAEEPKVVRAPIAAHGPTRASAGKCCWDSGICHTDRYCARSPRTCESECDGTWTVIPSLGQVQKQRLLRGGDHVFFQKLLRLTSSHKGTGLSQKSVEL